MEIDELDKGKSIRGDIDSDWEWLAGDKIRDMQLIVT